MGFGFSIYYYLTILGGLFSEICGDLSNVITVHSRVSLYSWTSLTSVSRVSCVSYRPGMHVSKLLLLAHFKCKEPQGQMCSQHRDRGGKLVLSHAVS